MGRDPACPRPWKGEAVGGREVSPDRSRRGGDAWWPAAGVTRSPAGDRSQDDPIMIWPFPHTDTKPYTSNDACSFVTILDPRVQQAGPLKSEPSSDTRSPKPPTPNRRISLAHLNTRRPWAGSRSAPPAEIRRPATHAEGERESGREKRALTWAERIWRSMPARRLRCSRRRRLESYSRIFFRAMAADRSFSKATGGADEQRVGSERLVRSGRREHVGRWYYTCASGRPVAWCG
jgi:hypothetical protein